MKQTRAQRIERLTSRYAEGLAAIDAGAGPEWAPELAAAIRRGVTPIEFARQHGCSTSWAYAVLTDPHGTKARRRKGTYTCTACGRSTPHDGSKHPPRRCAACEQSRNAERNAEIIERWNEGEPEWYIAEQMGLSPGQVRGAIDKARKRGEAVSLHRRRNRGDWPEIERLWRQGLTAAEIGERVGISQSNVYTRAEAMRAAGIDLPQRQPGPAR